MANNLPTLRMHAQRTLIDLPTRLELDSDSKAFLGTVATGVIEGFGPLEKRQEIIHKDVRLTMEGKRTQLVELAQSAQHALTPLEDSQKQVAAALDVLTRRVYPPPPVLTGTEAILQRMEFQEIRSQYYAQPQPECDLAYLRALENNQPNIVQALLSAPTGMMVTAEIVERGKAETAKQRDPENYERLLMKGRLLDEINALLEHARQAVTNLTGYENNL
jgi:hypothetical protein